MLPLTSARIRNQAQLCYAKLVLHCFDCTALPSRGIEPTRRDHASLRSTAILFHFCTLIRTTFARRDGVSYNKLDENRCQAEL